MKTHLLTGDNVDQVNVTLKMDSKSIIKSTLLLLTVAMVLILLCLMAFLFFWNNQPNGYTATITTKQETTVMNAVFANATVNKCVVYCQGVCKGYCCQAYYPYCDKTCGYCCCHY